MEKQNTMKYLAGACFGLLAVINLIDMILSGFGFWMLVEIIAMALVVASVFTNTKILLAVGFGIEAAGALFWFIIRFFVWRDGIIYAAPYFFTVIVSALLLFAACNSKTAKSLCLSAAGISVARLLFVVIRNAIKGFGFSFYLFAFAILFTVGAYAVGVVLDREAQGCRLQPAPQVAPNTTTDTSNNVDKLLMLSSLHDSGAITQEEFDAKKKQLLGL